MSDPPVQQILDEMEHRLQKAEQRYDHMRRIQNKEGITIELTTMGELSDLRAWIKHHVRS